MTAGKDWTMEDESKEAREPGCEHVCVIADRGWVFEGYRAPGAGMRLIDAHVVRRWDNGLASKLSLVAVIGGGPCAT